MKLSEKSRFLLVGAYNTGFGYAAFTVLFLLMDGWLHYLLIVLIAYCVTLVNSFLTQRHFVFKNRGNVLPAFFRFNMVMVAMFLLNLLAMAVFVDGMGVHPLLGQGIVTVLSAVVLFVVHQRYTFNDVTV